MELSEWVRSRQVTVAETAAVLGIGRVTLHRLMCGRTFPSRDTRRAIEQHSGGAVTIADMQRAYNKFHGDAA